MTRSRKRTPWYVGGILLGVALGFWAGARKARADGSTPNVTYTASYSTPEVAFFDPSAGTIGFSDPSSLSSNLQILGVTAAQTRSNGDWKSGGSGGGQLGQDTCTWRGTKFAVSGTTSGKKGGPFALVLDRAGLTGLLNVAAVTGFQVTEQDETIKVYFSAGS